MHKICTFCDNHSQGQFYIDWFYNQLTHFVNWAIRQTRTPFYSIMRESDCSYFLKRLFLVKARNTPKLSKPIQGILVTLLALGIHLTIDLKSRQQKVGHLVKLEFQK